MSLGCNGGKERKIKGKKRGEEGRKRGERGGGKGRKGRKKGGKWERKCNKHALKFFCCMMLGIKFLAVLGQ